MNPKKIVQAWVDAFNIGDVEAIAQLYAENAINHQVVNEPIIGREHIKTMFVDDFARAEMVCIVENIFEDGQWAILEWKDPKGLRGCGFFHVVNNEIIFQRGYFDKLTFFTQQNISLE